MVGERVGNVHGGGSGKRDNERGASARGRGSTDRKCGQVSRGRWRRGGVESAWVRRGGASGDEHTRLQRTTRGGP